MLGLPAEGGHFRDVEEFFGCAVGLGGVVPDFPLEADDVFYHDGEVFELDVLAGADVDEFPHVLVVVVFHEEDAGVGQVVHVEEFPVGFAAAPEQDVVPGDADFFQGRLDGVDIVEVYFSVQAETDVVGFEVVFDGLVIFLGEEPGEVEFTDESGQDVGGFQVEVVPGAVDVGGHDGQEIGAVLLVVVAAELDGGYLGHGVGFVGGLEDSGEKVLFFHGLGSELGIDAGGSQVEEFFDAGLVGGFDDVGGDDEVVVDEFGLVGVVGQDASHLGGGEEDVFGFFAFEEVLRGLLAFKI